jgi:hypothetical protein
VDRIAVINTLIEARGYRRYLEIGCQNDECFSRVPAPDKVGVDPFSGGTLRMTSDAFFAEAHDPFDLIFIDGDHHHDQVFRDVINALERLAPGGTVVMHDCLPPDAIHEALDLCGTAWRAFAKIRCRPDVEAFTGEFDFGVGILRKRSNLLPIQIDAPMGALTYADFVAHRDLWMRPHPAEVVAQLLVMPAEAWSG